MNTRNMIWKSIDGDIKIKDMDDKHLINTIKFIKQRSDDIRSQMFNVSPLMFSGEIAQMIADEEYENFYEEELREASDNARMNINWPDIHRWFQEKWMEACDTPQTEENKELREIYDEINKFVKNTINFLGESRQKKISGVNIF